MLAELEMPSSRGPSGTLPRSESEIVVDFARQQSSEDDMSHDSLNEGDCQSQSERRDSKNISRDSLYMDESDGDGGWSRRASQGEKSFQDDLESDNWHREKAEGNASRGSVKVVDSNMKRRITDEIYGKQPSPISSPTYSFRSTIDLLPSSRKRRGLRQQVNALAVSS